MAEGVGILMVDDMNMYVPFLHPLVVDKVDKVFPPLFCQQNAHIVSHKVSHCRFIVQFH